MTLDPVVLSVHAAATHSFSKPAADTIHLLEGLGVEGDAHCGATVKHRSRVARDPTQPNLRQVHLVHSELFLELSARGFQLAPGDIGENITTRGIDLLALPRDTRLHIGDSVVLLLTGLRNPCGQLDRFHAGLMQAVLARGAGGELIRKAGVMSIVLRGGRVAAGDTIRVQLGQEPHAPLQPV